MKIIQIYHHFTDRLYLTLVKNISDFVSVIILEIAITDTEIQELKD